MLYIVSNHICSSAFRIVFAKCNHHFFPRIESGYDRYQPKADDYILQMP